MNSVIALVPESIDGIELILHLSALSLLLLTGWGGVTVTVA